MIKLKPEQNQQTSRSFEELEDEFEGTAEHLTSNLHGRAARLSDLVCRAYEHLLKRGGYVAMVRHYRLLTQLEQLMEDL